MELLQDRRQTPAQQRLPHPDSEIPLALRKVILKAPQPVHGVEHLLDVRQKALARLRERHFSADLFKQGAGELPFQLRDLKGDGGLRIIQFLRGAVETALFHDRFKRMEIFQVHVCALQLFNFFELLIKNIRFD